MSSEHVNVSITRRSLRTFQATNDRGATVTVSGNDPSGFTPVELLLVAIAACNGMVVDGITSHRSEPDTFTVTASAALVREDDGESHADDIQVVLHATFPEGTAGDEARARLLPALKQSHTRLCTVTRTVERGTPIHASLGDQPHTGED